MPQIGKRNLDPAELETLSTYVTRHGLAAAARELGAHRSSVAAVLAGVSRPGTVALVRVGLPALAALLAGRRRRVAPSAA